MLAASLDSLMSVMERIADPRSARGVRYRFASLLSLVFLGLLSRHTEFAAMRRWALLHWDVLREPLGFPDQSPPHATTLSRATARFSLEEFQALFAAWLRSVVEEPTVAAVDGKTCRNGIGASGSPLMMLNVFAQDLKACLGQWPLAGDKLTEPEVLKAHLVELFATYPALRLLTADALFSQRNLAEMIVESGHDYLFQIKGNQPDILEAMQHCFAGERRPPLAHATHEKKGAPAKVVFFGSTLTMPDTSEIGWVLPVAESSSESTEPYVTIADWCRLNPATSSRASTRTKSRRNN
jgi:hypothetical protein